MFPPLRASSAALLLAVSAAGCVTPLLSPGGPIEISISHRRGSYSAAYYKNRQLLEESALMAAVADDPDARARARSGKRQRFGGIVLMGTGFALAGAAILAGGVVALGWHSTDSSRLNEACRERARRC